MEIEGAPAEAGAEARARSSLLSADFPPLEGRRYYTLRLSLASEQTPVQAPFIRGTCRVHTPVVGQLRAEVHVYTHLCLVTHISPNFPKNVILENLLQILTIKGQYLMKFLVKKSEVLG